MAGAGNHRDLGRAGADRGAHDMADNRLAADLMQHFRRRRAHAGALTRRQDDRQKVRHSRQNSPEGPSVPDFYGNKVLGNG